MSSIFYGAKVQENKPEVPRITQTSALRITRVSLNPLNSGHKKTSLFIKIKNNSFCIATLEKDKIQDKPLDIYLANSDVVTFFVQGKGELHLIGYFDPLEFDSQVAFDENLQEEQDEEDETEQLSNKEKQQLQEIEKQNKIKIVGSMKKTNAKSQINVSKNGQDDEDDDEDDEDDDEDFQLNDKDSSDEDDLAELQKLKTKAKKKEKLSKEDKKIESELKKAKDNKISNANIPRVVSRNNSEKKPKAEQIPSDSQDLLNDSNVDEDDDNDDDILVDDDQIKNAISKKLSNKSKLKVENFEGNKNLKNDPSKQQGIETKEQLEDQDLLEDDFEDLLSESEDLLSQSEDLLEGFDQDDNLDSDEQDDEKIIKDASKKKSKLLGEFRKAVMQEKETKKAKMVQDGKKLVSSKKQVLVNNANKNLPNPGEKKDIQPKPIIGLFAPSTSKNAQNRKEVNKPKQIFTDSGQGKKKKKRNKKKK